MKLANRANARPWFTGLTSAGVVLSHWLAYRIALPGTGARAAALEGSGHSYWALALLFAIVALVVGLGAFAFHRVRSQASDARMRITRIFSRLVLFQGLTFLAVEVVERLAAGGGLHSLLPVLAVGLLVQVLVALGGAFLLAALGGAIDLIVRLVRRSRSASRSGPIVWVATRINFPRLSVAIGAGTLRGPPLV